MNYNNSPTKSLKLKPQISMQDRTSVFNCKPKPISYIKGDTTHIAEISEDSINYSKNGSLNDVNSLMKNSIASSPGGMIIRNGLKGKIYS